MMSSSPQGEDQTTQLMREAWDSSDIILSRSSGGLSSAAYVSVKNTFVEVVEPSESGNSSRRSQSEGALSRSSAMPNSEHDNSHAYWLPSQLISSSASSFQHGSRAELSESSCHSKEFSSRGRLRGDPAIDLTRGCPSPLARGKGTAQPTDSAPPGSYLGAVGFPAAAQDRTAPADSLNNFHNIVKSIWCDNRNAGAAASSSSLAPVLRPSASSLVQQISQEFPKIPVSTLDDLNEQGLLTQIPRKTDGALTSVGSIGHESGNCRPCAYWFKGICSQSLACSSCHMTHDGQKCKRLRPSKQARMRMRARNQAFTDLVAETDDPEPESADLCAQTPYPPPIDCDVYRVSL